MLPAATLVDHPTPGVGYLLLVLGLAGSAVVVTGVIALYALRTRGALERAIVLAVFVATAVPVAILVHAACSTEYTLGDGELYIRSGFVMHATLPLAEIDRMEVVRFTPRVFGWGGGRGLANRLTDCLRITRRGGATYYISPSDPDAFRAAIESAAG